MQISKKELLELTKISYGQLYRWKRKGLIPDAWFIKKSSFTGQETFFPREEVLERINIILELKDVMPLEEIKEYLSGIQYVKSYKKKDIVSIFENINSLNENVSYFDLISLEITYNQKEIVKELYNISNLLNEENLQMKFYYFINKDLWVISDDLTSNEKYIEIDIQDIVKRVNKKLKDGGLV